MTTVLDRFLRYVKYDTQSNETSTTYPSTDTQLVLLRDLVAELKEIGLADAAIDDHGYVTATIPPTTTKAGVPTIGFIAHVDTSPEMPGAGVKPIVHRGLRRARPGAAGRSGGRAAARGDPRPRRPDRPRHRHRVGHDAARRRQQGRRRRDRDGGGLPRRASRDSARPDPHRLHAGRRGRTRHAAFRRAGVRRGLRLHDGRRQPRRDRDRELLGRRDHRHVSRLQHPSGLCERPDGERDQGRGVVHRRAAARDAVAGDDRRATRASSTPTSSTPASTARRCGCWSATS